MTNFDLPKLADEYVHRIGRTGRAGQQGQAISLVSRKDWRSFTAIRRLLQQKVELSQDETLPAEFTGYKEQSPKSRRPKNSAKPAKNRKKAATQGPKEQKRIRSTQGQDLGDLMIKRKKVEE